MTNSPARRDSAQQDPAQHIVYRERLRVPLHWWALGFVLVASLWLAVVVAAPGWLAAVVTVLALLVLVAVLGAIGRAELVVSDSGLQAGPAAIDWQYVGDVTALDRQQTGQLLGPKADARAFLEIRGYIPTAVQFEIVDPQDPHPYWVVSTRDPQAVCAAVAQARGPAADSAR